MTESAEDKDFVNSHEKEPKAPEPGTAQDLVSSTVDPERLHTFREHAIDVLRMAGPIIMSEIFQNTLPVVDIAFVGNLPDKEDLGAAALATVWFNLWNSTMLGFNTAIDTFLAQAYGAKEFRGFGLWTGNSLVIVMIATVFMSGLLALCGPMLKVLGQDEILAERAQHFSYRLIPGLFPYYAFKVLVKYLQTQNITLPGAWIGLLANLLNILGNWAFIFHFDMGLNGAPWATTITRFAECFVVIGYIYWNRDTPKISSTWPTFSAKFFCSPGTVRSFLKLALSGALSMSAEAWSFEIATILAGLLGTLELGAHIITLTIATFLFLSFPFAIGIAASIRVGQWIGDGSPKNAQRSSNVSFLLSGSVQMVLIIILLPCSKLLGDLFSSNADVAHLASELIPLSCIFMMGDAIQATTGGILRGLGRQKLVLWLNILAFWILAIPVGSLLTFIGSTGVAGLWWGYVVGIYVAGFIGILALKYRISWTEETKKATKRLSSLSSMQAGQTSASRVNQVDRRSTELLEEETKQDAVNLNKDEQR
jgi:MATE family multidrug resistance protein